MKAENINTLVPGTFMVIHDPDGLRSLAELIE